MKTINYFIDRGADYYPDHLMSLADDYEHFELRDSIFKELHCSEELLKELVQKKKKKALRTMESPKYISFFLRKSINIGLLKYKTCRDLYRNKD
jgi:hypothetical protein